MVVAIFKFSCSSSFTPVNWIPLSSWGNLHWFLYLDSPTSTSLACLFTFEVRISRKRRVEKGTMKAEISSLPCVFQCMKGELEPREHQLRTTTTNCRVIFISLNIHKNTVTFSSCGTYRSTYIEHGLPVFSPGNEI